MGIPTRGELEDMLNEGMSLYQISRKYNTTIKDIFHVMKKWNMVSQDTSLADYYSISRDDLKTMQIKEGKTKWQMAKELGYTQIRVARILQGRAI